MLLREIVETSEAVAATRSRSAKIEALAACIARMSPAEAPIGAGFLAGEPRQRRLGVGWAALRELPSAATEPSLSVAAVDAAFERLAGTAGSGSQAHRRETVVELFTAATASEQEFLRRLMLGDLRQGALQSIVTDAVARAGGMPQAAVRRALMLLGDPGELTRIALVDGVEGLQRVRLQVGRPVQPMLAATAPDLAAALDKTGPAALEWKLDGARIQVHRSGSQVAVFTRSLDDVTAHLPEVVEAVLALEADPLVLDGEAIALRPDGRPQPFQVTGSRFGSRRSVDDLRRAIPLTPFMFDVLHADGDDLLDLPADQRAQRLAAAVPEPMRVPRLVPESHEQAAAFQADTLARGHEGVVVKALDAPYAAGRRGAGWIKVKPRHTLDLVVLAAEWGHGRRRGWLSNLHLGARADDGRLRDAGQDLQGPHRRHAGLADRAAARARAAARGHHRPRPPRAGGRDRLRRSADSSRYPGGVALRFARVLRYRDDKRADEADTLAGVLALRSQ